MTEFFDSCAMDTITKPELETEHRDRKSNNFGIYTRDIIAIDNWLIDSTYTPPTQNTDMSSQVANLAQNALILDIH